jgi:hypothetical protein
MPTIALIALLLLLPRTPAAQDGLAARNEAFLRAIERSPRDTVATFFPRRGDWTWVETTEGAPSGHVTSVHRFGASETLRAISRGGPVCNSFWIPGGIGPVETVLSMRVLRNGTRWRRVAGNRFVPPGESARSPVFVQWRLEGGRWVVSSFGDVDMWFPRVIGRLPRDTVVRGAPGYAAGESWYVNNDPFIFEAWQYVKYGLPRQVADSLLVRVGHRGTMSIYARKGDTDAPDDLYLPIAPGEFQPYQAAESRHTECH